MDAMFICGTTCVQRLKSLDISPYPHVSIQIHTNESGGCGEYYPSSTDISIMQQGFQKPFITLSPDYRDGLSDEQRAAWLPKLLTCPYPFAENTWWVRNFGDKFQGLANMILNFAWLAEKEFLPVFYDPEVQHSPQFPQIQAAVTTLLEITQCKQALKAAGRAVTLSVLPICLKTGRFRLTIVASDDVAKHPKVTTALCKAEFALSDFQKPELIKTVSRFKSGIGRELAKMLFFGVQNLDQLPQGF